MKNIQGKFHVIESFSIKRKNEFYLLGILEDGEIQLNWFVNIPFNASISLTVRISETEDIEISSDSNKYKLIIIKSDPETIDLLLALHIGSEFLNITIEGCD